MKQIEATILGQSYMLACPPDGEALLRQAVAIVDREMGAIRDAGKVKARERIAVLTALNLAYQMAEASHLSPPTPASPATPPAPTVATVLQAGVLDIEHLIRRIDTALGDDGQLL
jgi:cell division protein ZapA